MPSIEHRQSTSTVNQSTAVSPSISDDHFLTFGTMTWAWNQHIMLVLYYTNNVQALFSFEHMFQLYVLAHQNSIQSLCIYSSSISIITDHLIESRSLSAWFAFSVSAPQAIELPLAPKQLCYRIFLLLLLMFPLMLLMLTYFLQNLEYQS